MCVLIRYTSIRSGTKAFLTHSYTTPRFISTAVLLPSNKSQIAVITNGTLYLKRRSHITNNCCATISASAFPPYQLFAKSLRHHLHQQQFRRYTATWNKLKLHPHSTILCAAATAMGSINCKEYVTTGDACASQPENGTTGSGSYHQQSTCETKMSDEYTDPVAVCNINDLQEQEMKPFDFDENTKVLVIRQKNIVKAIGNKCSHYGAPLHTGVLGDGRVRCPWHGACFNIDTGDIEDFPGLDSVPCYEVDIAKGGQVMVRAKRKDLESARRIKDMVKRDPANNLCYVVVGGGAAGVVCAETLRQEGFSGRIVMICKENYLPYDRVKLSKSSDVQIETIQYRKPEFYEEYGIETLMGVAATRMECDIKTLYLSNDTAIKYDKIFIATGSTPNKAPIKGADLKGVMVLREYDDVKQINKYVKANMNVVCLGSSFVAMEAAQSWAKKVQSVTVISRTEFPLMASFGAAIGERVLRLFREQGVNMIMSSGITEIIGQSENKVSALILKDGTKLPCDLLIMGTGSKYNTEFLIGSGLPLNHNGSITTDTYLKSLVDDVYVGGDIANAPVFSINHQPANIGHFQLAQYHGRIAAINMVNKIQQELRAVPFFFTMLFGKGFRYSGYGIYTDVLIEGDLEGLKFVAYFLEDDKVVAVASCGRDPIVSQFAEFQSQGRTLKRTDLNNPDDPTAWTKKLKVLTCH